MTGREEEEFYECWHAVCRGETCTDSPVGVQLHKHPPGSPAEPINATQQGTQTHTDAHRSQAVWNTGMNSTETWRTWSQSNDTGKKTQSNNTNTHGESSKYVLICLIKSQLLLPLATLPLCCIDSCHSNWQTVETTEGQSLFWLDTQVWQSHGSRPYWSDEESGCVVKVAERFWSKTLKLKHWHYGKCGVLILIEVSVLSALAVLVSPPPQNNNMFQNSPPQKNPLKPIFIIFSGQHNKHIISNSC